TSLTCRFKQIESGIWRRAVVFEPRQMSAAFWLQSNMSRTAFPRARSRELAQPLFAVQQKQIEQRSVAVGRQV
ncbi:MAG: hypothetical protein ACK6D5_16670, partial [Planctomyces sp.]